jgi:hypothetical protein
MSAQVLILGDTQEDEANARLIASATKLLKELKNMESAARYCIDMVHATADPKSNCTVDWKGVALHMYAAFNGIKAVRSAIAEAEGTK